jgi:hypothetical protein
MDSRLTITIDFPKRLHANKDRVKVFLTPLLDIFVKASGGQLGGARLEWFDTREVISLKEPRV